MEPKTFGYARVSSKGQNLDRQIFLLKEEGINERDIFVEKESAKDFERPVFRQLVDVSCHGAGAVRTKLYGDSQ